MNAFDYYSCQSGLVGLAQGTINSNTDTNGASIDKSGFLNVLWFIYSQTITDGAYVLKVQDSPDGSTWTDASSEDTLGETTNFVASEDNTVKRIGYNGAEKYARVVLTSTGTTTGGVFSGVAVKSSPAHGPVAID